MNHILQEMKEWGADGVVFHPIFTTEKQLLDGTATIHCDYTLSSIVDIESFPKSGLTYYNMVNGVKVYINPFKGKLGVNTSLDDIQHRIKNKVTVMAIEESLIGLSIKIRDSQNNIKGLYNILSELSDVWDDIGEMIESGKEIK